MDFLDKLVLPQSAHHMQLLKYLLVLTYILFIPYLTILYGSLTLSLYFKRTSGKNKYNYRFAKDLIDLITFNKGVAFALGLVPLISSAFCYAQLLHLTQLSVPEYLLYSFIFLLVALIFIYTYKYTFHLKEIFELASNQSNSNSELKTYKSSTVKLNEKSGVYGWIFLIISSYIFIASVQLASDTTRWNSPYGIFSLIFSLSAFIYYLQFLALSLGLTASFLLYKYFRPNSEVEETEKEYLTYIKNIALRIGLVATIILPALIVLGIVSKSSVTYSYNVFGFGVAAIFVLLITMNLFYLMIKESNVKFSSAVIYLFIAVITLIIIKDQYSFDTSNKKQFAMLAANYDQYRQKLNEELGISTIVISGADIYNGKCIACHKFDVKLVGPPYKETLPKYEGSKDKLIQYILNPVKINPAYPAMPNQGLKPKEAEAVADYLLENFKK